MSVAAPSQRCHHRGNVGVASYPAQPISVEYAPAAAMSGVCVDECVSVCGVCVCVRVHYER